MRDSNDVFLEIAAHVERVTGEKLVLGEGLETWPWKLLRAMEVLAQRVATLEDQLKK
jgi:hypothetical protein